MALKNKGEAMERMHDYWNEKTGEMESRPCTAEELELLENQKPSSDFINQAILSKLDTIDKKTPRAVREAFLTGDNSRVLALENEAVALRAQLVKA